MTSRHIQLQYPKRKVKLVNQSPILSETKPDRTLQEKIMLRAKISFRYEKHVNFQPPPLPNIDDNRKKKIIYIYVTAL